MCLCLVPTYPWKGYRGVGANRRGKSEGGGVGEGEGGGRAREEEGEERGDTGREGEKSRYVTRPFLVYFLFLIGFSI